MHLVSFRPREPAAEPGEQFFYADQSLPPICVFSIYIYVIHTMYRPCRINLSITNDHGDAQISAPIGEMAKLEAHKAKQRLAFVAVHFEMTHHLAVLTPQVSVLARLSVHLFIVAHNQILDELAQVAHRPVGCIVAVHCNELGTKLVRQVVTDSFTRIEVHTNECSLVSYQKGQITRWVLANSCFIWRITPDSICTAYYAEIRRASCRERV